MSERSERVATRFLQAKTYAKAKDDIMAYLDKKGWKVQKGLKVPHATSPDGDLRLWFKGQSIHTSEGNNHSLGSARSYTGYDTAMSKRTDIRNTTPEAFHAGLKKDYPRVDVGKVEAPKKDDGGGGKGGSREDFLKSVGDRMVPNPNPGSRKQHPQVKIRSLDWEHQKPFYEKWKAKD